MTNSVARKGVTKVSDLLKCTENEIASLDGMGRRSIFDFMEFISDIVDLEVVDGEIKRSFERHHNSS
ncbi:hypothetical protein [Sphingobacterium daejeonense]|uniref:hypothetical protein n=1 Tax=Sphingobacterium daejeonense TaxID=371142 RepID=UPI0035CD3995